MKKRFLYPVLFSFLILLCLLLCGCAKKIVLSSAEIKDSDQNIAAVVTPEDLALLDTMKNLVSADLSGSTCYREILKWSEEHPQVQVSYTVLFPGNITAKNTATDLDLSGLADADADDAMEKLYWLPLLKTVNLGSDQSGLSPKTALSFSDRFPEISFSYHCNLFGKGSDLQETELDLTAVQPDEIMASLDTIALLRNLKVIRLGSDAREDAPSWEQILALREAAPEARIDYSFFIFEFLFTLEDEEMDISYRPVRKNWPEILAIAKCMPNLKTLLMDSCGVANEDMATIRDALPETEVVWRINFGKKYTAHTNETRILASWGDVVNRDNEQLKYLTKIKYLDLGHNEAITDLSFVRYMPDLEVLSSP